MFNYKTDTKLHPFEITADGGKTWTRQLMTYSEAVDEYKMGHLIALKVLQKCENCGAAFFVEYFPSGVYAYMNDVCECEAEYHPYYTHEPTLAEFKNMFD